MKHASVNINFTAILQWEHAKAVGWGTLLQTWRSWVWFQIMSLEFFIDIILPNSLWPCSWLTQPLTEVPGIFSGGKDGQCRGMTLPTSCATSHWNLGASTSWNPQGLSRIVQGLLYLLLILQSRCAHCSFRIMVLAVYNTHVMEL